MPRPEPTCPWHSEGGPWLRLLTSALEHDATVSVGVAPREPGVGLKTWSVRLSETLVPRLIQAQMNLSPGGLRPPFPEVVVTHGGAVHFNKSGPPPWGLVDEWSGAIWPPQTAMDVWCGMASGTLGAELAPRGTVRRWLTASHVARSETIRMDDPAQSAFAERVERASLTGGPTEVEAVRAIRSWADFALVEQCELATAPPVNPLPPALDAFRATAWVHPRDLRVGCPVVALGARSGVELARVTRPFGAIRVERSAAPPGERWGVLWGQVLVEGETRSFCQGGDSGAPVLVALDTDDVDAIQADPTCTRWGLLGGIAAGPDENKKGATAVSPVAAVIGAWNLDLGLPLARPGDCPTLLPEH